MKKRIQLIRSQGSDAEHQGDQAAQSCDSTMRRRYEAIGAGIIVYDSAGAIVYANPMAEKILNLTWNEMHSADSRTSAWKVIDDEGRKVPTDELPNFVTAATGQATHFKVLGLQRNSASPIQWVLVSSAPVVDSQTQSVLEVIVTLIDITAVRGGAEALRESERRLIFALRSIHAGEWELDLQDFGVRYSPRSAGIFLGEPRTVNLYSCFSKVLDYFVGEDRDAVRRAVQEAVQNRQSFDAEGRILRADGMERWVQLTGRPYETDGSVVLLSGIVIDITERKLAELSRRQALIHSHEAVVNEIVKSFGLVYFILDNDLCYTAFNQPQAEIMKRLYGADIALERNYLSYINVSSNRAVLERNLRRALAGEVFTFEHYFIAEGRNRKCLEAVYCSIRNENKQVVGVAVFACDVSERKSMQALLQDSEYRYRKLVEDSNLILLRLNAQGEIVFLNKYGCEFFEYTLAELAGKTLDEALFPNLGSSRQNLKKVFSRIFRNKSAVTRRVIGEMMTRTKNRVWVEWSYHWTSAPDRPDMDLIAAGVDMTRVMQYRMEEKHGYQRRRRQELMNAAISGKLSQKEFFRLSQTLNVTLPSPALCLLLREDGNTAAAGCGANGEENQRQFDSLVDWLHEFEIGTVWQSADGICILLPLPAKSAREQEILARKQAEEILRQVLLYTPGLSWQCGASQAFISAVPLTDLYFQAQAALFFGPALLGFRPTYHWRDLGSYQLLVKDIDSEGTARFIEDQLGPLLHMEKSDTKDELMHTLRELATFEPIGEIAGRLHVHRGTVRYRKAVLAKLLERDLDSVRTMLDLSIAVKIWEARQRR